MSYTKNSAKKDYNLLNVKAIMLFIVDKSKAISYYEY